MYTNGAARFLVVHHASRYHGFYNVILDWVAVNLPEHRSRFDVHVLPCKLEGNHALMVSWLNDPVEQWSLRTYRQVMALTAECDAGGVPVVNRVERLARAGKFSGASLIRAAGLRTPRVVRITDARAFRNDFLGMSLPFFVREDLGHGSAMLRADTPEEARALPLKRFKAPVAVELIELPDPRDGLYRKYRYVVAGEFGVPHHVQASLPWVTRGRDRVVNDVTRSDELAYIESPCRHHHAFQLARQALGLDFLAFDYSLDADGNPVVWEANPYPYLKFSRRNLVYRNEALHRTVTILVALYFQRAGLPLPKELSDCIQSCNAILRAAPKDVERSAPQIVWRVPRRRKRTRLQRVGRMLRRAARRLRGKRRKQAGAAAGPLERGATEALP